MRKINLVVVHCSASDNPNHDDISVINSWHIERGFKKVGYHYFIKKNGTVQKGREDGEVGAHVKNYNKNSLGICFSGDKKFTELQMRAGRKLLDTLLKKYTLGIIDVVPHNILDNNKTCPNFDLSEIYKNTV